MTIRRGEPWGTPGGLPAGGVVVDSDAGARAVVTEARRNRRPIPPIGLLGGDLCRTLGGPGDPDRIRSPEAMRLPVDLGAVLLDGRLHWFVAHLVARRGWWRGPILAAMNAQFFGSWDVAPRSHPDDGRLDLVEVAASMRPLERLAASRRLPAGSHVPHPSITERRVRAWQVDLGRATPVWLDGERCGEVRQLSIRVEPDAATVVV